MHADRRRNEVIVGRYELLEEVGAGGSGVVYRAHDRRLDQRVAIKLLHDPRDDMDRARFEREMQLLSRLHHPHIVQLMDSGACSDGTRFAVLEWVEGETLEDILAREGPLSDTETRFVMAQVLDALACAHAHGMVHRDLKPANIMLTTSGARRSAIVLDFGVASSPGSAHHTGGFSPNYAAPEQLEEQPQSPRTDLYAWGLIVAECLAGEPVVSGAFGKVVLTHCSPEPLKLPESLTVHPLEPVVRRAIRKTPEERFASASQALSALESASRVGAETVVRRSSDHVRMRVWRGVSVVMSLCALVLAGSSLWPSRAASGAGGSVVRPAEQEAPREARGLSLEGSSDEALRTVLRALKMQRTVSNGLHGDAAGDDDVAGLIRGIERELEARRQRRGARH